METTAPAPVTEGVDPQFLPPTWVLGVLSEDALHRRDFSCLGKGGRQGLGRGFRGTSSPRIPAQKPIPGESLGAMPGASLHPSPEDFPISEAPGQPLQRQEVSKAQLKASGDSRGPGTESGRVSGWRAGLLPARVGSWMATNPPHPSQGTPKGS